jgi:hypothetical protein
MRQSPIPAPPTCTRKQGLTDEDLHAVARILSWTLANFCCSETAALQVFLMPAGIFARSRARPRATKNSVYPYILGHFAHPPLQKLAKVKLRNLGSFCQNVSAAQIIAFLVCGVGGQSRNSIGRKTG